MKLNGNREVVGILRGFDAFMNMVLDDSQEISKSGQQINIDTVVVRGNSVNIVEVLERF